MVQQPPVDLISILLLSWDRGAELMKTLEHNLEHCGYPYELLICDQGSKDPRVLPYLKSKNPAYLRENWSNEGVGRAFNQLYLRSTGKYIALMSNDIIWPVNWGKLGVGWALRVHNSGLIGIDWGHSGTPPLTIKRDIEAHYLDKTLNRIFGPTMFRREVVDRVGLFSEDFGPYGLEDSDFNERVNRSGFTSFYIPGLRAQHIVHDVGQDTPYRHKKDESLEKNLAIFWKRHEAYDKGEPLKVDMPEKKGPFW